MEHSPSHRGGDISYTMCNWDFLRYLCALINYQSILINKLKTLFDLTTSNIHWLLSATRIMALCAEIKSLPLDVSALQLLHDYGETRIDWTAPLELFYQLFPGVTKTGVVCFQGLIRLWYNIFNI